MRNLTVKTFYFLRSSCKDSYVAFQSKYYEWLVLKISLEYCLPVQSNQVEVAKTCMESWAQLSLDPVGGMYFFQELRVVFDAFFPGLIFLLGCVRMSHKGNTPSLQDFLSRQPTTLSPTKQVTTLLSSKSRINTLINQMFNKTNLPKEGSKWCIPFHTIQNIRPCILSLRHFTPRSMPRQTKSDPHEAYAMQVIHQLVSSYTRPVTAFTSKFASRMRLIWKYSSLA